MAIMRLFAITAIILSASPVLAQTRVSEAQRADSAAIREALDDKAADFWIYEDIKAGFEESRRTGKPILLSIR